MNQPVQLAGRRRAGTLAAMQSGLTQPMPPRVSIKAQRFTLIDSAGIQIPVQLFDQQFGMYLDVVIVGVNPHKSKQYFEYDYDPTRDEPPTCFSDNGIGPSAQSSTPQSPTCAACPQNVWGSAISKMTQKATKACSDRKNLAVVVVNDPTQLLYRFQVPPASLKNLSVLAKALQQHQVSDVEGVRPADPADVVTRIHFNPEKQGELLFTPMGFHQQLAPYIDGLIEKADASGAIDTITGANDVVFGGALPAPAPVQQLAAPAAFAPPQMQAPPPPAPFQPQPSFGAPPPPTPGQAFGGQPQQNGSAPPTPQAPRTRRGGARAGAGRPPAPVQGLTPPGPAPFQPQAPQQAAPQPGPAPFQPRAAQPAPAPQPGFSAPQGDIPPSLDRRPQAPQQQQPGGAPAFGMGNGAPPNADLSAAIDSAFGAPLQPRPRG